MLSFFKYVVSCKPKKLSIFKFCLLHAVFKLLNNITFFEAYLRLYSFLYTVVIIRCLLYIMKVNNTFLLIKDLSNEVQQDRLNNIPQYQS